MDNVIVFPSQSRPSTEERSTFEGATLFMHQRNTTLIVHLVNPRGQRDVAAEVSKKR